MVSLRRRRLLGFCSGVVNSVVAPFPIYFDNEGVAQFAPPTTNPVSSPPMPLAEKKQTTVTNSSSGPGSSNASDSCSLKHHCDQPNISGSSPLHEHKNQPSSDQELKCRKRHKRKHVNDQEQCVMRGVYFKNMKRQAAIKVEKKQIHLGTVGSQEEAARFYDRAAFMCGREPNFELSEEEKQELRKYKWDEFLAITRLAISNKKVRRRHVAQSRFKSEASAQDTELKVDQGAEEAEQEESTS